MTMIYDPIRFVKLVL